MQFRREVYRMRFRLRLFGLAAALSIAVAGAISYRAVGTLTEAMGWVSHTREVIADLDGFLVALTTAESANRAYLLTGDPRLLDDVPQARAASLGRFQHLVQLTRDNPAQQQRLRVMGGVLRDRLALFDQLAASAAGGVPSAQQAVVLRQSYRTMQDLRRQVDVLRGAEDALLRDRLVTAEQARRAGLGSVAASTLLGLLALAVLFLASRRYTTQLVAEHGDLLQSREETLAHAASLAHANEQLRQWAALLEQRVAERTEALEDANQELRAFAHTVAHDLRAPLRNVQGFAAALLEDERDRLSDAGKMYARRLSEGAGRMDQLIADLLNYARLSRTELRLEPVSLERVVATVLQDLQAEIRDRGAVVQVGSPLPEVQAHFPTLVQVLANLVANATKFQAAGVEPRVDITARSGGDRVLLSVQDNGIGIAAQDQERIFEVFERLHGPERYAGTGIGLAIVRKGMERMRGGVHVESAPGHGARFTLALPHAQPVGGARPEHAEAPTAATENR